MTFADGSGKIDAFLRVLDPADNSTGGGSASAIAGAMAAALVGMVSRLSITPQAAEPAAFYQEIAGSASALSETLLAGAGEDARAFDAVMSSYRLPKGTEAETTARRAAIQSAIIHAARVPMQNAEHCARVTVLAKRLEGRANPRALSDLQCAVYLAGAGLQGCLANVEINLESIKDPLVVGELRTLMERLRQV